MTTVLCVGSGAHVRRAASVLADAGYGVAVVPDETTALDAVERDGVECVLSAADVPDGSGRSLCRELDSTVPVVVCDGDPDPAEAGRVLAAGADGYVPAPSVEEVLLDRVRPLVEDGARTGSVTDGVATGAVADGTVPGDRQFERLIEQSPLAVVQWNTDFEVVGWNPAAEELFGYDAADAIGRPATFFIPEEARDHVGNTVEDVLSGTAEPLQTVNDNVTADGERITCRWYNTSIQADGEVVSGLSFAQDVTDEVRRAESLETLHWTTSELFAPGSREDVAERVAAAAETVLEADAVVVYLRDGPDEWPRPVVASGLDPGDLPSLRDTPLASAFEHGGPGGIDHLSESDVSAAGLSVESLECHPIGEHGVLCFGVAEPDGIDPWTAKVAALLVSTAEAALDRAEQERRLRRTSTIVETVADGICTFDDDGRFGAVNDTFVEMTGYDRNRLLGASASLVLDDATVERLRAAIETVRASGRSGSALDEPGVGVDGPGAGSGRDEAPSGADSVCSDTVAFDLHTRGGDTVPCEATISQFDDEEWGDGPGTTSRAVAIVRDVSERASAERALREREAKIEALHETAHRLEGCRDDDAVLGTAVDAARDVLEFDQCSVRRSDGDRLHTLAASISGAEAAYPRVLEDADGPAARALETGDTVVVGDLHGLDLPVPDRFRSALAVPVDEETAFHAVATEPDAFDDVDVELAELLAAHVAETLDRIGYEAELRVERDRLAALFESVPDPVVRTRIERDEAVVEAVNPAFEDVFGYDAAEIRGASLDDHIVPSDRTDRAHELTRRGIEGEIVETEVQRLTAVGTRDFLLTVVPIEVASGPPVTYAVYTDITERKQRQQRLEVLNRVLRHDLRNGMNVVRGSAEYLADHVDEAAADHLSAIEERADELVELADKTRTVEETLETDPHELGPVDVVEAVETAIDDLEDPGAAACVVTDTPDRAPARVDQLLPEAIRHAIRNAVVHHDGGDPSVEVRVEDRPAEDAVEVVVADDGPGIPEQERVLVTEQREITQLRHGSGLGLWLVNWVVTGSGGTLHIEDREPRGTAVRMVLPQATADRESRRVVRD